MPRAPLPTRSPKARAVASPGNPWPRTNTRPFPPGPPPGPAADPGSGSPSKAPTSPPAASIRARSRGDAGAWSVVSG